MRFTFLFLILLSPIMALAETRKMCSGYKNLQFVSINEVGGTQNYRDYTCEDFNSFDELTGRVLLLSPAKITSIDVMAYKDQPEEAAMDFVFNHMHIGFNPEDAKIKTAVEVIFTHEIGHAIFSEYLYQTLPEFKEYNRLRQSEQPGDVLALLQYINLLKDGKCEAECTDFIKMNAEKVERVSQRDDLISKWGDANEVLDNQLYVIAKSYHELFADIVATVSTNSPSAVSDALFLVAGESYSCRDMRFSRATIVPGGDPHCEFSGIRKQIYENLIKPANTLRKKRQVLADIAKIFGDEIGKELKKAQKNKDWKFNPEAAFEQLKKSF